MQGTEGGYRLGDYAAAALQRKIVGYLSGGRPVIANADGTIVGSEILNCGIPMSADEFRKKLPFSPVEPSIKHPISNQLPMASMS